VPGFLDRRSAREDSYTRALGWLGRRGGRGLELAVRLDLLRSLRPGAALRRLRGESRAARQRDDSVRPGYRRLWSHAAAQLGAEISDPGDGFLEIHRGDERTRVWHSWAGLDDAVTIRFAEDKTLARRALLAAGLPVPEQRSFRLADLGPARELLESLGGSFVVKPTDAAGGSGATTGVRTTAQLQRAALRAGRLSDQLLIERQVEGDLYRVLLLDGEVLDVIRRDPPRVVGDGRSSVAELVAAENDARVAAAEGGRTGLLRIDLDAVFSLEHQGLRPSSVPAAGQSVTVKTVVNQNGPRDNRSVRDRASAALLEDSAAAAGAIGLRLAGVDLITGDPGRSLRDGSGGVIEVNGTPGLHYHYHPEDPERSVPVAVPILERALAAGS
jgi:cyanophycin synthetase